MPGVAPLLARMNDHDLGWDHVPDPCRTERNYPIASQKAAARRSLLDRENDELDRARQVDVARRGLVRALPAGCPNLRGERREAQPTAVGREVTATRRMAREDHVGCGHDMLGAVRAPARGRQAAP